MSKTANKIIGQIGEDLAAKHLVSLGLEIIERNYANKFGELDLICKDKNIFVFVEVKTKVGDQFGSPEEMISRGKISKVKHMATVFLTLNHLGEQPCRLDAVCIVLNPDHSLKSLKHYPSIT